MAYHVAGKYLAHCTCNPLCPCSYVFEPTTDDGQCHAATVFHIERGSCDEIDLSGVVSAAYLWADSNIPGDGFFPDGCVIGLIVDENASEQQAEAVQRIFTGEEGGKFRVLPELETQPLRRARINWKDGDPPTASIGDEGVIQLEPFRGLDGGPVDVSVSVSNSPLSFGHIYAFAKSIGRGFSIRGPFKPKYGESGAFEWAS